MYLTLLFSKVSLAVPSYVIHRVDTLCSIHYVMPIGSWIWSGGLLHSGNATKFWEYKCSGGSEGIMGAKAPGTVIASTCHATCKALCCVCGHSEKRRLSEHSGMSLNALLQWCPLVDTVHCQVWGGIFQSCVPWWHKGQVLNWHASLNNRNMAKYGSEFILWTMQWRCIHKVIYKASVYKKTSVPFG